MRRLARITALWFVIVSALPAGLAFSEPADPLCQKKAPSGFIGIEILRYAVNVLMFTDAADANIYARQISKTRPFIFEASLTARTKGVASVFSNKLYQEHSSLAVEWPDETSPRLYRFVSVQYVLSQEGGFNPVYVRFKADYVRGRLYRWHTPPTSDGYEEKPLVWKIPLGVFLEDPLTALLNFRLGLRRLPAKGEKILVKTFPFEEKSLEEIRIRRANSEEEEEYRLSDGIQEGEALIFVDVPPGVLRKGMRIQTRILFNEKTLLPRLAVAEKVIPFFPFPDGDAAGTFVCFGVDAVGGIAPRAISGLKP